MRGFSFLGLFDSKTLLNIVIQSNFTTNNLLVLVDMNLVRLAVIFIALISMPVWAFADKCIDIFPGTDPFTTKLNQFSQEGGVTCNGGTCSPSAFYQRTPFPSINASGDFSSTSLTPGVYEHDGWGLGDGATITFSGNGTAVVYFEDNDVVINKETKINVGGEASNVLLVFKGKLKIEESAQINAFIYVAGNETTIEHSSVINGAIAAKNKLTLKHSSTFNYQTSDLDGLNTQGFCEDVAVIVDVPQPTLTCDNVFVDGATTHGASSNIYMHSYSYIFDNPDTELETTYVTNAAATGTCGTGDCTASGSPISDVVLGTFLESSSSTDLTVPSFTSEVIGDSNDNEYDDIYVWVGASLTTSSAQSTYRIKNLYMYGFLSTLNLSPGDYYIENLTLNTGSFIHLTSPGDVRIFAKNVVTIGSYSEVNHNAADGYNLQIIGYGDVVVDTAARVGALIYAESTVGIEGSAHVYGAASGSHVFLRTDARIYYECGETAPVIDHYEISFTGPGLTCEPLDITVKACTNSIGETCMESSENVSLYLEATGSVSLVSQELNFNGSKTTPLSYTTAETVTMSIANATVTPLNGYICNDNSTGACQLAFEDAAFKFFYNGDENTAIDRQVAGVEFANSVNLKAVRNNLGVCETIFNNETVKVNLSQQYVNPSVSTDNRFYVNNKPLPEEFELSFDAQGVATLTTPRYDDAGEISLYAQYSQDDINIVGASNSFWVRPDYLVLESSNATWDENDDENSHLKTGDVFTVQVTGKNRNGVTTKNYQANNLHGLVHQDLPSISDGWSAGDLIIPGDSSNNDTSISSVNSPGFDGIYTAIKQTPTFTNGIGILTGMTFDEVAIISLKIEDRGYGGSDINNDDDHISSTDEVTLGRFTPAFFQQTVERQSELEVPCVAQNNYVYTGQMNTLDDTKGAIEYLERPVLEITAYNQHGVITENYSHTDFFKLDNGSIDIIAPQNDTGAESRPINSDIYTATGSAEDDSLLSLKKLTTNDDLTAPDLDRGTFHYRFASSDNFVYIRDADSEIAPFGASFSTVIDSITDKDGIKAENFTFSGESEATDGLVDVSNSGVEVRYGRIAIANAYGSDTDLLPVNLTAEYFNGTRFIPNTLDSCTVPVVGDKEEAGAIRSGGLDLWEYRLVDGDAGDNLEVSFTDLTNLSVGSSFTSGTFSNLYFTVPEDENDNNSVGQTPGVLLMEYEVPEWLKYDWLNDDSNVNPTTQLNFGLFRGNDRVISWREIFED